MKGATLSIERVFHCDGPECDRRIRIPTTRARPRPDTGLLTVTGDGGPLHFCGWDCVLRHAAQKEPETIVPGSPLAGD